ncbi:MAG: thiamine-phosphate kinase [Bacteroidia bacterium]|nr:thiamine-phosphate kinase [Bacteroidia bacterium]
MKTKTTLSDLGEFGLIEHLTKNIVIKHPETIKGVGDDAAVLEYKNKQIVVTTDLLVEGIHFDLVYTPLKHLGYKAVVVNLSDVYAMNAEPKQITVSIAVSGKMTLEMIEELYSGIHLACEKYNIDMIGGDTTSSVTGLLISITAIGEADKKDIVYRNGAKENDLICVSGDLGAAYMGLLLLEREKQVFNTDPKMQPDFKTHEYILERQLKPEARKDIIKLLRDMKIKPTSMIDISDGLSSELIHICRSSKVGCKIYGERIPIDVETGNMADELNLNATTCALNGGEDYELLFTVPVEYHDMVRGNLNFMVIGHITNEKDGMLLIGSGGHVAELKAQGWNAFLRKE